MESRTLGDFRSFRSRSSTSTTALGSRYQVRASSIRSLSTSLSDCRPASFILCSSQRRVSRGNRVLMLVSSIVLGVRAICRRYRTGDVRVKHDSYTIKLPHETKLAVHVHALAQI